jgi:tRNA pseudouridine55 synthase
MNYDWIYLINKPVGITSFSVIARLRRVLGIKKIWHAWTLDPFAHGLMIVAVGRDYTRQIDQYIGMDKTYTATIKLGETSDTMDSEWPIQFCSDMIPSLAQVQQVVASQVQTYEQLPPAFSAKKINGVAAYKLARAGKEVELKTKEVTVYMAKVIGYEYPLVTVQYRVSSGTYIRVLAHELGQKLWVWAYCYGLCRDSIGQWQMSQGIDLEKLQDCGTEEVEQLLIAGRINQWIQERVDIK